MSILLVAGVWLAIAVLASLLIGRGVKLGSRGPSRPPTPRSPLEQAVAGRYVEYVSLSLAQWSAAAHEVATRVVLEACPVTTRAIPSHHPERDG